MYFIGENDRRHADDYRPELHDSDGLLIAAGSGEWLWRPSRIRADAASPASAIAIRRGSG